MALVVQAARGQVGQVVEEQVVEEKEEQGLVQEEQEKEEQGLVQEKEEQEQEQESLHQPPFQVILQNDTKVSCIPHSNPRHHLTKLA